LKYSCVEEDNLIILVELPLTTEYKIKMQEEFLELDLKKLKIREIEFPSRFKKRVREIL
jgi:hypothetical protein